MLGKGGDRGAPGIGKTEEETARGSADQCKKTKDSGNGKEDSRSGEDGGMEATEPGALGQLVCAAESARQEP